MATKESAKGLGTDYEVQTRQYSIHLVGVTPLIMHRDNFSFTEKINRWRSDPENKKISTAGDDRSPAWTWIGYLYDDQGKVGISSDNLMTMLREAGAKLYTGKGKETFKRPTQYGLTVDQVQLPLLVDGKEIATDWIEKLVGVKDFTKHEAAVEAHGFELFAKRAVVGHAKHVRVRPRFQQWEVTGTITVLDEEESGLTQEILTKILTIGGSRCGLCDWRPSSGSAGSYGKFKAEINLLN